LRLICVIFFVSDQIIVSCTAPTACGKRHSFLSIIKNPDFTNSLLLRSSQKQSTNMQTALFSKWSDISNTESVSIWRFFHYAYTFCKNSGTNHGVIPLAIYQTSKWNNLNLINTVWNPELRNTSLLPQAFCDK